MAEQIKRQITQIRYNWRQSGDLQSGLGEDFDMHHVGECGVIKITNCTPTGEPGYIGLEFYDVEFENGNIETIYNPNSVVMEPVEESNKPEFGKGCEFLRVYADNVECEIVYCDHFNNKSYFEGNCNKKDCPLGGNKNNQ